MKIYNISNYIISDLEQDLFSKAILHFKKGRSIYVRELVNCSVRFVNKELRDYDIIIRALGSDELNSKGNKPLDYLCFRLADCIRAKYLKNIIYKKQIKDSLKNIHSKSERLRHLLKNYYFNENKELNLSGKKILIVDDVYTTGATLESIESKIRNNYSDCTIDGFVLGKSTHEQSFSDVNDKNLDINIEDNYYDISKYSNLWCVNGYVKIGFLKAKHQIFPQEWTYDIIEDNMKRYDEIYIKILLEESKELFITSLGRLKALFGNTDFFVYNGDMVSFNNIKYYIGTRKSDPYLITKNYRDLYFERIIGNK